MLLGALAKYFSANATREVAALQVTASRAGEVISALDSTRNAVSNARQDASAKHEARETTFKVLRVESASERGVYAASPRIGPAAWAFFNLWRSRTLKRRKRRAPSWW